MAVQHCDSGIDKSKTWLDMVDVPNVILCYASVKGQIRYYL